MTENIDYGDTDLRSMLEGDSSHYNDRMSPSATTAIRKQEFKDDELVESSEATMTIQTMYDAYADDCETIAGR